MKHLFLFFVILFAGCSFSPLKSPRDVENFRNTPVYDLAVAVDENDPNEIERILKTKKADIDLENRIWEMSVLEFAVVSNKQKSVDCLMRNGADPFLKSKRNTAITLAAATDNYECLKTILKYAKIDTIPQYVARNTMFDAYDRSKRSFDLLVRNGIHLKDTLGIAVYIAVYFMDYDYALELLKCGAVFDDSAGIKHSIKLGPTNTPQPISYLLLNKEGCNFNDTSEIILNWRRKKLLKYLRDNKLINN